MKVATKSMNVQRVEWKCPSCETAFSIPAGVSKPATCPQCDAPSAGTEDAEADTGRRETEARRAMPIPDRPGSMQRKPLQRKQQPQGESRQFQPPPPIPVQPAGGQPTRQPVPEVDPFSEFDAALDWPPQQSARRPQPPQQVGPRHEPKRYPALRLISTVYRGLAILAALAGVMFLLYTVQVVFTQVPTIERTAAIMTGLMGAGISLFVCILLLTVSEIVRLFIDIEKNTRANRDAD